MNTPDYLITYAETPYYLTTGKRYTIVEDFEDDILFGILGDKHKPKIALVTGCAHLEGRKWKKGYIYHV